MDKTTEKRHGFRSFLKKPLHRSKQREAGSTSTTDGKPKNTPPSPKGSAEPPKSVVEASTPPIKISRRALSEKRLEEAAIGLNNAMSKGSKGVQVPDAIGLQHYHLDDIEGTAHKLENAIDIIIDERKIRATSGSRQVWKNCIKGWFKAVYPYINTGLKEVGVRIS
jgi:hypothetical protein